MIDPRSLDGLLEELALVSREAESFDLEIRFAADKALAAMTKAVSAEQSAPSSSSSLSSSSSSVASPSTSSSVAGVGSGAAAAAAAEAGAGAGGAPVLSELARMWQRCKESILGGTMPQVSPYMYPVQELMGDYISVEEAFLSQSVKKAIAIDEHPCPAPKPVLGDGGTAERSGAGSGGASVAAAGGAGFDPDRFLLSLATATSPPSTQQRGLYLAHRFSQATTSTLIDDVLFIIRKCTDRAFSTCNPAYAAAIVNHTNTTLSHEVKTALLNTIAEYTNIYGHSVAAKELTATATASSSAAARFSYASSASAAAGGAGAGGSSSNSVLSSASSSSSDQHSYVRRKLEAEIKLLVAVNNLEACATHTLTLRAHLQHEFDRVFSAAHSARHMVANCIANLADSAAQFQEILKKGVHVVAAFVTPYVRPLLQEFEKANYNISERQYQGPLPSSL